MKEIKLSQNKVALIDEDMFEYLSQWKWYCNRGYAVRHVYRDGKRILLMMHRVVAQVPEDMETDHINLNKLDNQRHNLRSCNSAQNQANKPISKVNTSGYKGVYWHKPTQRWRACIRFHRKRIYLGLFIDIEDAARAYNEKAKELYGEFAYKS
jgi:hypothetical protein